MLENEHAYAFRDVNPVAPVHVLVVPKAHLDGVAALDAGHGDLLAGLFAAVNQVAEKEGVTETGYRVVANAGADAGQAVRHLHFHVLGGRPLGWPPGRE